MFLFYSKEQEKNIAYFTKWRQNGTMQAHLRVAASLERCNLRLREEVVRAIDQARLKRPGYVSRNSWIAEAIQDKLKSEGIDLSLETGTANDA